MTREQIERDGRAWAYFPLWQKILMFFFDFDTWNHYSACAEVMRREDLLAQRRGVAQETETDETTGGPVSRAATDDVEQGR